MTVVPGEPLPRRDSAGATAEEAAEHPVASAEAGWAVPGVWLKPVVDEEPLEVGAEVAALEALVDGLSQVNPRTLSPGQAMAEAQALQVVQDRLRVLQLARLADVHERELFRLTGHVATGSWRAAVSPDADPADLTLARRLPQLPHLHRAVQDRAVCLRAAELVRTRWTRLRPHLDRHDGLIDGQDGEEVIEAVLGNVLTLIARQRLGMADDDPVLRALDQQLGEVARSALSGATHSERTERAFTLLATHLPIEVLPAGLDELLYALLPNELEEQQARAERRRAFRLERKPTGGWRVHADLTPECGERLFTALGAEARRDSRNPADTEAWQQARAEAEQTGQDLGDVLAAQRRAEERGRQEQPSDEDPTPADEPSAEHGARDDDTSSPERGAESDCAAPWGPTDVGGQLAPHPEPTCTHPDGSLLRPRSRSERLHDAFNLMLDRYLGQGLGGEQGKVPVQVTIIGSTDLVEGRPGALAAKGASGQPLSRSLLRRMWCDAHVTLLLMSSSWKPLGIVHSGRTLTAQERKASLAQTDYRCAGLGCCPGAPDPLRPLVPHHLVRYSVAGRTSTEETVWICDRFHHDLHTGKRTLQLRDGRRIKEDGIVSEPVEERVIWG